MEKTVVAICYDFDKTLATDDMQAFSFIPNLGLTTGEFWDLCADFRKKEGVDNIISFLYVMIDQCKRKGIKLTREYLNSLGKDVKFFDGVTTWFKRLNQHAESLGIQLEHYIISSGNKEIIEGSAIAKEFKGVYGCEFLYNEEGEAFWPKVAINYTLKTQYLFRIVKGAIEDENKVNDRIEKKHVEFRNMIYIGDGLTDVPCMTLVKEKGGFAISVYPSNKKEGSIKLLQDNRVNYACRSDFGSNSQLEKLVKLILESISIKEKLFDKETSKQIR